MAWLTSLSCSTSILQSSDSWSFFSTTEFIFLAPCVQRIRFMVIDLVFLLALLAPSLKRAYHRFLVSAPTPLEIPLLRSRPHFTLWYKATVSVIALLAIAYTTLCLLALSRGVKSEWNGVDLLFYFFQAMTNAVILLCIANERKIVGASHPSPLRMYWNSSFFLVCLYSATALVRLVSSNDVDQDMEVDDIFSLATFPFYTFLFVISINRSTGITSTNVDENSDN